MGRGQKSDSGGALIVILGLIIVAAVFTFVTGLVYGGILLVVMSAISLLLGTLDEPLTQTYLAKIPAILIDEQNEEARLLATKEAIGHVYAYGERLNFRLTVQSEYRYFDQRSYKAENLNGRLQALFLRESNHNIRLRELRAKREWMTENWIDAHRSWVRTIASARGSQIASIFYFPTVLLVVALPVDLGFLNSANIVRLTWFDIPWLKPYYPALICGTVVSFLAGLSSGMSFRSDLIARGHFQTSIWLREQEAAIGSLQPDGEEPETARRTRSRSDGSRRDQDRRSKPEQERCDKRTATAQPKRWFEVLDISSNASRQDIKAAWKEKIRINHPDLTGKLDPEFQKLAEQRTKEINTAKDEGFEHVQS